MARIELDKTDRRILAVMQENGRLSNQEVAEQVSLSPSPCLRRIRRLEQAGVIRKYVALLDADKLGLGLLAYVNVRLEKHGEGGARSTTSSRAAFAAAVMQWPEVVACHAMTGLLAMQASPNLGGACRNGAYYDHGRADLMAKEAYTIADEMMKARAE